MGYLFGVRAAPDIEKVGRHPARILNNVHGGHCQSRAIDHAPYVAVQLDVIQAVFRSFYFQRVFFRDVPQFLQFRMAEQGVVIEVHLGIEREQSAIGAGNEWIDLHQ